MCVCSTKQPQYHDAANYLSKYRQLQTHALGLLAKHVVAIVSKAADRALSFLDRQGDTISADVAEQQLFITFRASCGDVGHVLDQIEQRATRQQCVSLAVYPLVCCGCLAAPHTPSPVVAGI